MVVGDSADDNKKRFSFILKIFGGKKKISRKWNLTSFDENVFAFICSIIADDINFRVTGSQILHSVFSTYFASSEICST